MGLIVVFEPISASGVGNNSGSAPIPFNSFFGADADMTRT